MKLFSIKPELATLVDSPPQSEQWLHELKFDGYRILAFLSNKEIKLISRNGNDWTKKFKSIAKELEKLPVKQAVLDGEVVMLDEQGYSNFQLLQNAMQHEKDIPLHYYLFDLLFLEEENLTQKPLLQRKQYLQKILADAKLANIHFSSHIRGHGDEVYKKACEQGYEGIVSKQANSCYHFNRSEDWLKVKCSKRQEFIIIGYTVPQGARQYFGALLLGAYYEHNQSIYCGRVGTGFNRESLRLLYEKMQKVLSKNSPLAKQGLVKDGGIQWLKPILLAEVQFTGWTDDGLLRHPSFKGLREDKSAAEITIEQPKMLKQSMTITHPEKIVYENLKLSKSDLANYYQMVGERLLPYIANKPVTLLRCPDKNLTKCFYQKHWHENFAPNIQAIAVIEKSGKAGQYLLIKNAQGLMTAAQFSVLEIHPWLSRKDKLTQPDQIIFDLDPAPDVPWSQLLEGAKQIEQILTGLHLKSFIKLTGGKGLHIVIPIKRIYQFEQAKAFAKAFADALAKQWPKLFTSKLSKEKRCRKIFIDYLRNSYGATAIAPFSPRANAEATIAVPVSWQKLFTMKTLMKYSILEVEDYLTEFPEDPWSEYFSLKQRLPNQERVGKRL